MGTWSSFLHKSILTTVRIRNRQLCSNRLCPHPGSTQLGDIRCCCTPTNIICYNFILNKICHKKEKGPSLVSKYSRLMICFLLSDRHMLPLTKTAYQKISIYQFDFEVYCPELITLQVTCASLFIKLICIGKLSTTQLVCYCNISQWPRLYKCQFEFTSECYINGKRYSPHFSDCTYWLCVFDEMTKRNKIKSLSDDT